MIRACLASFVSAILLAGCTGQTAEPLPVAQFADATPDAVRGVHNVTITVSDIDDTLAFYSSAVPYELVERASLPASSMPSEILAKRDGEIEAEAQRIFD